MATSTSSLNDSGRSDILDLCDVVKLYDLPQTVAITYGSYVKDDTRISQGDIILLRSDFPKFLSLNIQHEAAAKKDIAVSSDCQVKFYVLPPKDTSSTSEIPFTYPTIKELLTDCPTYFEATSDFEQPYLPRVAIKAGDRFRFGRIIRKLNNDRVCLECVTNKDTVVQLPLDCNGEFKPLLDKASYTLRELVSMAPVSRRLKISPENTKLKLIRRKSSTTNSSVGQTNDQGAKSDKDHSNHNENGSTSLGVPLTFKGVINLRVTETMLEVSPWNDLEVRWHLPKASKLCVRLYSPDDYEVPILVKQKQPCLHLNEFVIRYDTFPIQATLMNSNEIPSDFLCYLRNASDIIVHRLNKLSCLIVQCLKKDYYVITPNVHVTFIDYPNSYGFVFELLDCAIGTQIRVMEDVASDFPYPYSLRYGDVIKITSNKPTVIKKKKGSVPEYQVLACEKLRDNGEFAKLIIPIDLEVQLFELTDMSAAKVYKLIDLLCGKQPLPNGLVSVLEEDKMNRLPLPSVVRLVKVIHDEVVLVSPLRLTEEGAIEPLVKNCLAMPLRQHLLLSFSKELHLPKDYFVLPRVKHRKNILVEKISYRMFKVLERQSNDSENYEEITHGTTDTTEAACSQESMPIRRTTKLNKSFNRLSQMFTKSFNKVSRAFNDDVPLSVTSGPKEARATDNVYTCDPVDDGTKHGYDDENLYEFVDIRPSTHKKN